MKKKEEKKTRKYANDVQMQVYHFPFFCTIFLFFSLFGQTLFSSIFYTKFLTVLLLFIAVMEITNFFLLLLRCLFISHFVRLLFTSFICCCCFFSLHSLSLFSIYLHFCRTNIAQYELILNADACSTGYYRIQNIQKKLSKFKRYSLMVYDC